MLNPEVVLLYIQNRYFMDNKVEVPYCTEITINRIHIFTVSGGTKPTLAKTNIFAKQAGLFLTIRETNCLFKR